MFKSKEFLSNSLYIIALGVIGFFTAIDFSSSVFYILLILGIWLTGKKEGIILWLLWSFSFYSVKGLVNDLSNLNYLSGTSIKFSIALIVISILLYEYKTLLNKEREILETDKLTGVKNKKGFFRIAELQLKKLQEDKKAVTLIYLSLDNFEQVKNNSEHYNGDGLLPIFAANLGEIIRKTDVIGRLDNNEFAILSSETSPEVAQIIVKRIQNVISEQSRFNDLTVNCRVGVLTLKHPDTTNNVISLFNELIYKVKISNKNAFKKEAFNLITLTV